MVDLLDVMAIPKSHGAFTTDSGRRRCQVRTDPFPEHMCFEADAGFVRSELTSVTTEHELTPKRSSGLTHSTAVNSLGQRGNWLVAARGTSNPVVTSPLSEGSTCSDSEASLTQNQCLQNLGLPARVCARGLRPGSCAGIDVQRPNETGGLQP